MINALSGLLSSFTVDTIEGQIMWLVLRAEPTGDER
jgi:hypothetical protein